MSTTIRTACPTCGDVELTPTAVTVRFCGGGGLVGRGYTFHIDRTSYAFHCTGCDSEIRKPACDHTVALLLDAGVAQEFMQLPAEALEEHTGPALTADDLLDLHLQLQTL